MNLLMLFRRCECVRGWVAGLRGVVYDQLRHALVPVQVPCCSHSLLVGVSLSPPRRTSERLRAAWCQRQRPAQDHRMGSTMGKLSSFSQQLQSKRKKVPHIDRTRIHVDLLAHQPLRPSLGDERQSSCLAYSLVYCETRLKDTSCHTPAALLRRLAPLHPLSQRLAPPPAGAP